MKNAVHSKTFKICAFLEELGVDNVKVLLALGKDSCRKGVGRGCFDIIIDDALSEGWEVNANNSFFVGDADGGGSFAGDADLRFAKDAGVKFFNVKKVRVEEPSVK